jgi:CBS domain containing-hemolysin-like protein
MYSIATGKPDTGIFHDFRMLLSRYVVGDILPWEQGKLQSNLIVNSNDSLNDVLVTIVTNKAQFATIYDGDTGTFVGFIDMEDIMAVVVDTMKDEPDIKPNDDEDAEDALFGENLLLSTLSSLSVANYSKKDTYETIAVDQSALDVLDRFACEVHRIAVFDGDKMVGVATQEGLGEFILEEHADVMDSLTKQGIIGKVSDLFLPREISIVTAVEDELVLSAFKRMTEAGISALPIVKKQGDTCICGVISASDVMLWDEWEVAGEAMRFHHLSALFKNVDEFVHWSKEQRGIKFEIISCTDDTPVDEVLKSLITNGVHHVMVLDKDTSNLRTILNYADVLRHFATQ